MGLPKSGDAASRFSAYVEGLASVIGHADRAKPLRDYCVGLMMPCERKSVELMAAIAAPERTAAQHQSLLHFVGEGNWSDEKVLAKVRELVLPEMERHGPIEAWIIDDTGFPKKGRHSVGVGRQYCGELGKQDNCQIAVTLSIANHHASLPAAYRLYLPKEWATDRIRRRKAGVPKEVTFKTKPAIAHEQLRWACAAGLRSSSAMNCIASSASQTLDRRANARLDQPQSAFRPRLRALCAIRRRVYPSRNDPHHAPTIDQPNSLLLNPNFLDRLLANESARLHRAVTTQEATLPRNTSPCMAAAGAPAFSNAAAEPPHRCEHGQALNMLLSTFLGRSSEQPEPPHVRCG